MNDILFAALLIETLCLYIGRKKAKEVKKIVDILTPPRWISVCAEVIDEVPGARQKCLLDSAGHLTSHHHWDCNTDDWMALRSCSSRTVLR